MAALACLACGCVAAPVTPAAAPPSGCGDRPPGASVYNPDRLEVLDPCRHFEGTVAAVAPEADGDYHVWIRPDAGYEQLLNAEDHFQARPALLAEVTPDCGEGSPPDSETARRCPRSRLPIPSLGDHVAIDGPWVLDTQHGWREIHPVDALRVGAAAAR